MLKGEIKPKFFKVRYWEATNWGYEPVGTKYFKNRKDAKRYALRLVKILKQSVKKSDDWESVDIDNEEGIKLDFWRAEEGKVIYYHDC
ncbi:MAG: hypothetical protein HYS80_01895 [Candidatus Aenigmarchaeota archaeon]|nr:hypothetical protein [Candidatus Aenigmarchaeota archaeon]